MAADLGLVAHAAERHADELAVERAGDRLADRGLARSGRADQRQDRAGALVLRDAALLPQLAHGQVLDDALLDVLEPGVVGVEHLARVDRVEPLLGALAPRHREQPVEVGADHRRLAALVAHPLEPADLALGLLANRVGHLGLGDPGAVVVGDRAVVLAELLADRLHLAAEDVLALLLLSALLDVVADAAADLQLGQALALEAQRELEPLDDVDRLEQLDLLLEGDLRGVARRCRRALPVSRIERTKDEMRPSSPRSSRISSTIGAVLALELAGLDARRLLVRTLVHLDAKATLRVGVGRAGDAAVQADRADGRPPPGSRIVSATSATVPTRAYSPSWRGTSSTRSSSPTSAGIVTFMFGKTTMSSSGISSNVLTCSITLLW